MRRWWKPFAVNLMVMALLLNVPLTAFGDNLILLYRIMSVEQFWHHRVVPGPYNDLTFLSFYISMQRYHQAKWLRRWHHFCFLQSLLTVIIHPRSFMNHEYKRFKMEGLRQMPSLWNTWQLLFWLVHRGIKVTRQPKSISIVSDIGGVTYLWLDRQFCHAAIDGFFGQIWAICRKLWIPCQYFGAYQPIALDIMSPFVQETWCRP